MNKPKRSKPSSVSIPRSGSLLDRLQRAPVPEDDALPYLDQLMIFLEAPSPEVRDRWKKGAEMCAEWGFPCNGASVWRLYRAYAIAWRLRFADEMDAAAGPTEGLDIKVAQLAERRIFAALSDPDLSAESLAHFVSLELRRQALAFAQTQYREQQEIEFRRARIRRMDEEEKRLIAEARFNQFKKMLGIPSEEPMPCDES